MNLRETLTEYAAQRYACERDNPWEKYPRNTVLRHSNTKKWFALFMPVPGKKLGLADNGEAEVLNLKCRPDIARDLCCEKGIIPAYHMNRKLWITVFLDGSVPEDEIKALIDMSYELTK